MAPAHVNRELRKGGNAPVRDKDRRAAWRLAKERKHVMRKWRQVPTPIRGEEVWVSWCKNCGGALVWRSRYSIYRGRTSGDVMTFTCRFIPDVGNGQNKTQTHPQKQ